MSRLYYDANQVLVFEFTDYLASDVSNISYSGGTLSVYRNDGFYYNVSLAGLSSMRFVFSDGVEKKVLFLNANNGLTASTDQNEWLVGTSGNDTIGSKAGDDTIFGGAGNDTYQFAVGNGKDTIIDTAGQNTIKFTNVNAAGVTIEGTSAGLSFKYSETDAVILGSNSTVANFSFADGTTQTKDQFISNKEIEWKGTDGADTINAYSTNDIIKGGKGNDTLDGKAGNDTFTFFKGDGNDQVSDTAGTNKILLADTTLDAVDFKLESGNLVISYGNNDSVTIKDYLYKPTQNFSVQFADGQVLQGRDLDDYTGAQYWVRVLLSGEHGTTNNFSYAFPTAKPAYTQASESGNWGAFSAAEQASAIDTLTTLSQQANVNFALTNNLNVRDVMAFQYADLGWNVAGGAYNPTDNLVGSDVYIANSIRGDQNVVSNEEKYSTTHEILHAIGLQHSFGNDFSQFLAPAEESAAWTIMSYNFNFNDYANTGLRAFDVAAVQAMYGVETSSRTGNDTYRFDGTKGTFVWDGAGVDTIDASTAAVRATINLNDGSWSYLGNAKSQYISSANQLTINVSTTIENAIGTAYNDELIGNAANNALTGGAGNDILRGALGDDVLDGGTGADTLKGGLGNDSYYVDNIADVVVENASEGTDTVLSSISYVLGNNLENLTLTGSADLNATGNALNNTLLGNSGNNVLDGGLGDDIMRGGAGNDTYVVNTANEQVYENASEGTDTVQSGVSYVLGNNLENLTLTGTAALNGTGNALNNTITGNSANNVLDGSTGADTMIGGAGNDTYYVDNVNDVIVEIINQGTDSVVSSINFTLDSGNGLNNLTLSGTGNINATGNGNGNSIIGNTANNILNGGGNNDSLNGDAGNDTLIGGAGNDSLTGGAGADLTLFGILTAADNTAGNGSDTWTDFKVGNTLTDLSADKIDISALLVGYSGDGSSASLSGYVSINQQGSNSVLSIDRDGSAGSYSSSSLLTLNNVITNLASLLDNHQLVV